MSSTRNTFGKRTARGMILSAALVGAWAAMSASGARATTFTWVSSGIDNNWSTPENWLSSDPLVLPPPPATPAEGDTTDLRWTGAFASSITSTQNVGTIAVNSMNFDFTSTFTVSVSGSSADTQAIELGAGGITSSAAGTVTFASAANRILILTADQTWANNTSGPIIISMRRDIQGDFKITKSGAGTIELQGANLNWTGGLDIQDGFIRGSGQGTAYGAGTISSTSDNNTGLSASGSVDQTIAGPMILGGAGSFAFRGSNAFNVNNTLTLTSDKTISTSVPNTAKPVTFNGSIGGDGFVITKTGSTGLMIVKAANTHGGFNVAAGTLQADNDSELGAPGAPLGLSGGETNSGIFQTMGTFSSASRPINLDDVGGTFDSNGFDSAFGPVSGAGGLTKVSSGVLTVASVHAGTLTVSEGSVVIAPNGNNTSVVKNLSLAGDAVPSAALDLNNNDLVIDYDTTSPMPTVLAQIKAGQSGPNGIRSSVATANQLLGVGEASSVLGASGGTFSGETVDGTAVLVKYTYAGDANLDGQVDVTDLGALATNWQTSSGWTGGDFNYDGFVDVTDLGALATNWQAGVGSPLGPSLQAALASVGLGNVAVPEPASFGAIGICLAAAASRRRTRFARRG